jgi:hypothetical protein
VEVIPKIKSQKCRYITNNILQLGLYFFAIDIFKDVPDIFSVGGGGRFEFHVNSLRKRSSGGFCNDGDRHPDYIIGQFSFRGLPIFTLGFVH